MTQSPDDFDLDALKSALNKATPAPDLTRKAENIALASKNFADLQGSRAVPRPTSRHTLWTGAKTMLNTLTTRAGMTVTTAIVACGFMIASPMGRDILNVAPAGWVAQKQVPETSAEQTGAVSVPAAQADALAIETQNLNDNQGHLGVTFSGDANLGFNDSTEGSYSNLDITENLAANLDNGQTAAGSIEFSTAAPDNFGRALTTAPSSDAFPVGGQPAPTASVTADGFSLGLPVDTETFANDAPNPLKITREEPVSTFSIDVDTAAYSLIRSSLTAGQLPPPDAVRIEELINYFPYDYPAPDGQHPFQPTVNVFETPWNADTQLVHIGIQGERPAIDDRPPLNLVFLIDTSGSMNQPDKLPLLRQSFRLMLDNLRPEDEVAIVTYAGSSTVALQPTQASDRTAILSALTSLTAGGSTNGQGGLEQAYVLADSMAQENDVSRVILATDGDFNVGLSDPRGLETYIADKRDSGTYLSVLGFGRGNLQDTTMQALAQNGNGTAAYIDTLSEAQKVLVDNLTGALFPIANDVKIQVEFNPATVAEYRLIGYETRALNREDFNNDAVDAGELGAGHNVTAIYEITPVGSPAQLSDPLRYQTAETTTTSDELGFLRLRYKAPGDDTSQLIETPFSTHGTPDTDALFAASIAAFAQLLRDDSYLNEYTLDDAISLANANRGDDPFGYRTEAVQLMRLAQSLAN